MTIISIFHPILATILLEANIQTFLNQAFNEE